MLSFISDGITRGHFLTLNLGGFIRKPVNYRLPEWLKDTFAHCVSAGCHLK